MPARNRDPASRCTDDFAQKLFGRASDLKIADLVDEVAKARGLQSAQVSLAWVLTRHPTAAPIIGATRSEHMGMAVAALEVKLEPADLEKLEKAYEPRPRGGHF